MEALQETTTSPHPATSIAVKQNARTIRVVQTLRAFMTSILCCNGAAYLVTGVPTDTQSATIHAMALLNSLFMTKFLLRNTNKSS